MGYTVLARKYRPQKFIDLVGQEHVTQTIGNAIATGRVAHAFLFTGARGVGKTSTARLLAKALNCERGPTPEPCNQCDPCLEITQGNDMDVLEMDGASNNSVEDVRRLQENLPYRPARDRFKVVIVDEVHMLSTGAFNAFLKTLEEPPTHVKFIFATTEVHKVPITIRSRCQRHDFRLIPQAVVAARVHEILAAEQIAADETAVHLVAREAAGSMRDALTVLDQVLACCGDSLNGTAVAASLGIAGRSQVHEVARALLEGDPRTCLRTVYALQEQGLDVLHFARQLLEFIRDLVVLRVLGEDATGVDLTPDERTLALALSNSQENAELSRAFAGVSDLIDKVALSANPGISLEMGLVSLADRPRLRPLSEVVSRLDALLPNGPGNGPTPAGGGGTHGTTPTGNRSGTPRSAPNAGRNMGSRALGGPGPDAIASATAAAASVKALQKSAAPPESRGPVGASSHAGTARPPAAPHTLAPRAAVTALGTLAQPSQAEEQVGSAALAVAAPPDNDACAQTHVDATDPLPPHWPQLVEHVRRQQPALGAILEHGIPTEVNGQRLRIGFPAGSFFGRQAQSGTARSVIRNAAKAVLDAEPEVEIHFGSEEGGASLAFLNSEARKERTARVREAALEHPLVQHAIEVFPEARGQEDIRVDLD